MKSLYAIAFVGWLACGGTPVTTSAPGVDRLEEEFGGPSSLMDFFARAPDTMIEDALDAHDVGFLRQTQLTDCNQTFPVSDRSTWHAFDGEFYFVETNGRPNRAYKYLPPIVEAPRITTSMFG